ncbi:MAG: hypothetical protein JNG90_15100, partial [Planctomycetaceae bacterium]|nr:hypothetical protein [Planctomycetaceae bacterium]
AWIERGYKLDMGKSCIRFKSLAQVPLDVVGTAIRRVPVKKFIAGYEAATGARLRTSKSTRPPAAAKRTARSVPRRTAPRASR